MNDIGRHEIVTHRRVVALFRDKLVHRPLGLFDRVSPALDRFEQSPVSSEHLALRSEHSEPDSEHLDSEQEDRLSELASAAYRRKD